MRNLPVPVYSLCVKVACPSHQTWPFTGQAITGAEPAAILNLKTFEWHCQTCGARGLITRAFREDFISDLRNRGRSEA